MNLAAIRARMDWQSVHLCDENAEARVLRFCVRGSVAGAGRYGWRSISTANSLRDPARLSFDVIGEER
jgi:hypothetical protein